MTHKAKPVIRAFASVDDVDAPKRRVRAIINTATVDRYRTVILPSGATVANYLANRVVLLNHDPDRRIGKCINLSMDSKRIIAYTQFKPEGQDADADKAFTDYVEGYAAGWSINFDPTEGGPPTPDEIRANPDWAEAYCIYRQWDLLEYSAVTVPANAEALTIAFERGYLLPELSTKRRIAMPAPPPAPTSPAALAPLNGRRLEDVRAELLQRTKAELRAHASTLGKDAVELAKGMV